MVPSMSYQRFFHLHDAPFRLTPDPDYYFPSRLHREALETLLYAIHGGEGFVQLTGDPGLGKTLIIRSLLNQLGDDVKSGLILHPRLGPEELFRVILADLGMDETIMARMNKEGLLRAFRDMLLETGAHQVRTVVIIDEAQDVPVETLEELRLLSNLETSRAKLLQIILVGQLELEDKLGRPELKQLHQRISIRYRLQPLTLEETSHYINHRLKVAGCDDLTPFSSEQIRYIHQLSKGIPRTINLLCERALMAAYVDGEPFVDRSHVHKALQSIDVDATAVRAAGLGRRWGLVAGMALILAMAGGIWFWRHQPSPMATSAAGSLAVDRQQVAAHPDGEQPASVPVKPKVTDKAEQDTGDGGKNLVRPAAGEDGAAGPGASAAPGPGDKGMPPRPVAAAARPPAAATGTAGPQSLPPVSKGAAPTLAGAIVPDNFFLIGLDRNQQQGYVWKGAGEGAVPPVTRSFSLTFKGIRSGIYLLGQGDAGQGYLFSPHSFFPWNQTNSLLESLVPQMQEAPEQTLVPVLVFGNPSVLEMGREEAGAICQEIQEWADSWRNLDLERHLGFYGDVLVTYRLLQNKPFVIDHQGYARRKQELFARNQSISLQLSDPFCALDPGNSQQGVSLFFQRYISKSYVDAGIKVLYWSRNPVIDAAAPRWVISGRLWIPMAGQDQSRKRGPSTTSALHPKKRDAGQQRPSVERLPSQDDDAW